MGNGIGRVSGQNPQPPIPEAPTKKKGKGKVHAAKKRYGEFRQWWSNRGKKVQPAEVEPQASQKTDDQASLDRTSHEKVLPDRQTSIHEPDSPAHLASRHKTAPDTSNRPVVQQPVYRVAEQCEADAPVKQQVIDTEEKAETESEASVPRSESQVTISSIEQDQRQADEEERAELLLNAMPDDVDYDEFIQRNIAPVIHKAQRNMGERIIGSLAEKILKKFIPVDEKNLKGFREEKQRIQESIILSHKERGHLETQQKALEKGFKYQHRKMLSENKKLTNCLKNFQAAQQAFNAVKPSDLGKSKAVELSKKLDSCEEKHNNQKVIFDKHFIQMQAARQVLTGVEGQLMKTAEKERKLTSTMRAVDKDVAAAVQQQKSFNKQVVNLLLNLRRIHQGSTALGEINAPALKIPLGEGSLDLRNVRCLPVAISTRPGPDGQPLVDVTLKDIHASVKAPIEGGVNVDLDVEVSDLVLTLGGPVGKAAEKYLSSSGVAMGYNLGQVARHIHTAITGSDAQAPVHVGVNVGDVVVKTHDTNADVIVRGIVRARRNPASALHKGIAGMRLPVAAEIRSLHVESEGDVQVKVDAKDLVVNLNPDSSKEMKADQRNAELKVSAKKLDVDVTGPVGLAGKVVSKMLPPDPLTTMVEPLGVLTNATLLDRLPETACHHLTVKASDLNVELGRNVNRRTTLASQEVPVWTVEGDSRSKVTARTLTVTTRGDLEAGADVRGLVLEAETRGKDKNTVKVKVDPKGQDAPAATVTLACKPGLMKSLGTMADSEQLSQLLLNGQGVLTLPGRVSVEVDNKTGDVDFVIDEGRTTVDQTILVRTPDIQVMLPKTIQGDVSDVQVHTRNTSHHGIRDQRTEVNLQDLNLSGKGSIVVESGLNSDGSAESIFTMPVDGRGHASGGYIISIRQEPVSGGRVTSRTLINPGNLSLEELDSGELKIEKLDLKLDKELNGSLSLGGARVQLDELLNASMDAAAVAKPNASATKKTPVPKAVRWLLKNKTVSLDGSIPVNNGSLNVKDLARGNVRIRPDKAVARDKVQAQLRILEDKAGTEEGLNEDDQQLQTALQGKLLELPRASFSDRAVSWFMNRAIGLARTVMGGRTLHLDGQGDAASVRSALFPGVRIPLPESISGQLVVNEKDGSVNIAATQYQITGLYCMPDKRIQALDGQLYGLMAPGKEGGRMEALLAEVSGAMAKPARVQEAMYLLNGLPVEQMVSLAKSNPEVSESLSGLARQALKHPASMRVAMAIFNACAEALPKVDIKPTAQELEALSAMIMTEPSGGEEVSGDEETSDFRGQHEAAVEFAHLLYNDSQPQRAAVLIDQVLEKHKSNVQAFTLKARLEWEAGRHIKALAAIRDAAMVASTTNRPAVRQLLDRCLNDKDVAGQPVQDEAMLLRAALDLRLEAKEGSEEAFTKGLETLEMLTQRPGDIGGQSRSLLRERCLHAYQHHENLDQEKWELWNKTVEDEAKKLKAGHTPTLDSDGLYKMAISQMYCHLGVNPDLASARKAFQAIRPQDDRVRLHLSLLDELVAEAEAV